MVDAKNDGAVGIIAEGADQHALGAGFQVQRRLFLGGEDAGAFQGDVDAQILVRQLGGVLDRRHLHAVTRGGDDIAIHRHGGGEAAMDAVIAQQMGVGLDRTQIVDRHHFDVAATPIQRSHATPAGRCGRSRLIATRKAILHLLNHGRAARRAPAQPTAVPTSTDPSPSGPPPRR